MKESPVYGALNFIIQKATGNKGYGPYSTLPQAVLHAS